MTEKRFTLEHFEDTDWAYDNGKSIYTKEMVELLNEQHEQIERLKRNFKALEEVKCELAEENEQLKSELLFKNDLIQQLKIKLNMNYYKEWKKCNLKYIEVCEELLEENKSYKKLNDVNEQLKQSVKRQQSSNEECSKYIEELVKENERLKKELKDLQVKFRKFNNHMIGGDVE